MLEAPEHATRHCTPAQTSKLTKDYVQTPLTTVASQINTSDSRVLGVVLLGVKTGAIKCTIPEKGVWMVDGGEISRPRMQKAQNGL